MESIIRTEKNQKEKIMGFFGVLGIKTTTLTSRLPMLK